MALALPGVTRSVRMALALPGDGVSSSGHRCGCLDQWACRHNRQTGGFMGVELWVASLLTALRRRNAGLLADIPSAIVLYHTPALSDVAHIL